MPPRYSQVPQNALDQEALEEQARAWANDQYKQIAQEWRQAQGPDPLAGLRQGNPYLARTNADLYPSPDVSGNVAAAAGSGAQPGGAPFPVSPSAATASPPAPAPQTMLDTVQPGLPANRPDMAFKQFSPYDHVFARYAGDLAGDPDFMSIVAAGTLAESGWDASNRTGDKGHSWGLFQMHDEGAGHGMGDARLDPDQASAVMVPKYAAAYRAIKQVNPNLSGPDLAAYVAQAAERSADESGAAYAAAYRKIMGGAAPPTAPAPQASPVPPPGMGFDPTAMQPGTPPQPGVPLRQDVRDLGQAPQTTLPEAMQSLISSGARGYSELVHNRPTPVAGAYELATGPGAKFAQAAGRSMLGMDQPKGNGGIAEIALRSSSPALSGLTPDPSRAVTAGLQAAGVPGTPETGQKIETPLGNIDLGPRELIGFAAGAMIPQPGGPGGKALGAAGQGLAKAAAGGGGKIPPGGVTRALGGFLGKGGPGPGTLEDTFGMWDRNRKVRNPGLLATLQEKWDNFYPEFQRQVTDRFVDLNALGRNVEAAVSTYMGRLPAAEQRVKDELTPLYQALGAKPSVNGHSMVDNLNTFVKLQRDLEVANAKGTPGGLRTASAGGTGAAHAQSLINELKSTMTNAEWAQLQRADVIRQGTLDRLLDERVQSGLISNELRQWLLHNYPHYNPTVAMRNVDEALMQTGGGRKMTQLTNNLKRLMDNGIKDDTEEPALSTVRALMRGDIDIRRNNVVNTIIDALQTQGHPLNIRPAAIPGDKPGTLSFYRAGKRYIADVPKEVERAAKALDESSMNWFLRIGQVLNTPLRVGAVAINPAFQVTNAVADFISTFIREGGAAAMKVPKMYAEAWRQGPIYREFMRAGGGMSALSSTEHADVEKLIQKTGGVLIDDTSKWLRYLKDTLTLKPVRRVGEAIEMGPRLASYEAYLQRNAPKVTGTALGVPGGPAYAAARNAGAGLRAEAAMAGRRATIDFARGGHAVKLANSWVLFLNARVQGTLQVGRTLRDNPNSRWRLASVAALATSTYAWNRQFKEEWADIPDWEKDSHAIVILGHGTPDPESPGSFKDIPRISIPLREWSVFVTPLVHQFASMDNADPRGWDSAMLSMARSASPVSGETAVSGIGGMIPAPARTPLEIGTNKKFFTEAPIESARFENLPPSERQDERTTAVAKWLYHVPGIEGHLSPKQIDFMVAENLGGFGRMLTGERINPAQAIIRSSGGQGETNKFSEIDRRVTNLQERVAESVRQSPDYQKATPDNQRKMQRQAHIALTDALKEQFGISTKPLDYGLPGKYRGVTNAAKEDDIDKAIRKYEAWLKDRKSPRPTPEEQRTAARYRDVRMRNPAYAKAVKEQTKVSTGIKETAASYVK